MTGMPDTRGARSRAFTLLTPENHYASRLPSFPGTQVYKLVTPRLAPARFGQYLLVLPEETLRAELPAGFENFFFGLAGTVKLRWEWARFELGPRGYAYIPHSTSFVFECEGGARLLWIKRRFEPWPGLAPPVALAGHADEVSAEETATAGLRRRELLPREDPRFDFNISLMAFEPGVSLPQIKIHDEEHGLYMTAGDGACVLDGEEHEVRAEDFIYTAPYCPQGFRAGEAGGEYLLYRDGYRDGF